MCGVCQGLTTNKHGYLSVSDTVMMVTIVFFILDIICINIIRYLLLYFITVVFHEYGYKNGIVMF